ncbi:MAG: hypothetical protein FGM33_02530 [Candidatus Kapabacteria bacterium]|nr:hypothetical protein [Candidatus Kapabacteria bacterium]
MSLKTYLHRPLLLACFIALVATGCGTITRTERDVYTTTTIDTMVTQRVTNPPGERDNGIIAPSSRVENRVRTIGYADSIKVREYPNFIRWSLFEGVSLLGSAAAGSESTRTGLFGLYRDVNELLFGEDSEDTSQIFDGYMFRMGLMEWKLDWFDHAPDWTWGITGLEIIRPDADRRLVGAGALTLTKRFYLSSKIPYISIRPSVSLSLLPSQYVNTSVSADVGSIGGVNLRAYVGYAFGSSILDSPSETITVPYAGLGVSVMDFLNREEELDTEWKYHEHSAWEIGAAEIVFVGSQADRSIFAPRKSGADALLMKGLTARFGIADIALPIFDYRLSLGTALANIVFLGSTEFGIGVLPLRLTYHWTPLSQSFRVEPFAEVNFAPSSFFHAGVRMAFPIADQMAVHVTAGWANGNTGSRVPGLEEFGFSIDQRRLVDPHFGAIYLGVGASLFDHLFSRKELRYGKGYPHE